MTDFGVYAYNLKMDKHTQDSRVIRMKLWLHLNQVLKPFRSSGNKLQIVDICLSCLTESSTPLIFNMQKVKKEILEI